MGTITKPNDLVANTPAKADDVDGNFETIYSEFNGNIDDDNVKPAAGIQVSKISGTAMNLSSIQTITGAKTFTGKLTADEVSFPESAGAPSTDASEGAVYTKDTDGQPELFFREESDGDEVQLTSVGGVAPTDGFVVQVVNFNDGEVNTGSTVILQDDNIPQITNGDEFMTLAITPKSTTNKLKIEVLFHGSNSAGGVKTLALFQDTTPGALATSVDDNGTQNNNLDQVALTHFMTAGTVISTTFRVRAGGTSGTITFNGESGSRLYGGNLVSSITITEIKAS